VSNVEFVFTIVIPVILVILMFGMGMSLTSEDFRRVYHYPVAAVIGLGGQLLLLPALAFALALLLRAPAEIAIGGMLLAACPGGITSNGYVFVSRGDLGLSVTLTAITSVVTIATLPLITWFSLHYFLEQGQVPDLPVPTIIQRLVLLTAVPIGFGMLVRYRWPDAGLRGAELVRRASLPMLIIVILAATISTFDTLVNNLVKAGIFAVCLNLISMAAGFLLARRFALPHPQVKAITFEIGVQNLSLAILVAVTILKRPDFAVLAVVYALVMKISVLTLIYRWRAKPQTGS
jgi:BASS family bile acid:Na+ symporter